MGRIPRWPFTQHDAVSKEHVTVIDSRSGQDFAVHAPDEAGGGPGTEVLAEPALDRR